MSVPLVDLADRPRFAAKMIAVWRWHHMAQGEDLAVTVMPGEWPDGVAHEIKGCPVVEDKAPSGAGGMLVLGRKGTKWYGAYQLAIADTLRFSVQELAIMTAFMEVAEDRSMKLWLHPSPETGEVPMWQMAPRAAS